MDDRTWRPARGAIIAFVGPDAAGKSTIAQFLVDWLGRRTRAEYFHLGSPRRTPVSRGLRLAFRAARWSSRRMDRRGAMQMDEPETGLVTALRAVAEALERSAAARRCAALAAGGTIVVTDRYPSTIAGAANGPEVPLDHTSAAVRWLGRVERRLYATPRLPDVVVHVEVPVEECVRRNAARPSPKPETMIRQSHHRSRLVHFPGVPRLVVDNTRPVEQIQAEVVAFIQRSLASPANAESTGS